MAPPLPNPAHGDQLIETTRYRVTESAARRGWRPLMARGPIEGVGKHREFSRVSSASPITATRFSYGAISVSSSPSRAFYLCAFSFIMANRRSVTGSRLLGSSAWSVTPLGSNDPENGCSRKDEDKSVVRLPWYSFRKTLRTLILSPSVAKSISLFSSSRCFKASLTEFLAF